MALNAWFSKQRSEEQAINRALTAQLQGLSSKTVITSISTGQLHIIIRLVCEVIYVSFDWSQ